MQITVRCALFHQMSEKHRQFAFLPLLSAYHETEVNHKGNGRQLEVNRNKSSTIYWGLTRCRVLYAAIYSVLTHLILTITL